MFKYSVTLNLLGVWCLCFFSTATIPTAHTFKQLTGPCLVQFISAVPRRMQIYRAAICQLCEQVLLYFFGQDNDHKTLTKTGKSTHHSTLLPIQLTGRSRPTVYLRCPRNSRYLPKYWWISTPASRASWYKTSHPVQKQHRIRLQNPAEWFGRLSMQ